MSKFERLLFLLDLIRSKPGLQIAELSKECKISGRSVYRDIATLCKAGVPIGFDQGYRLLSSAFLPPLNLNLKEYLVLKLGLTNSVLSKNEIFQKTSQQILNKIDSGLNPELKNRITPESEPFKVDVKESSEMNKQILWFKPLELAILNNQRVRLTYETLQSGETVREIEPYGLVFKRHAWYLVAYDRLREDYRTFRLSRVKKLSLLDQTFARDKSFSLEKYFEGSWEMYQGETIDFKIRFWGKGAKVIETGKRHPTEKIEKLKDGSVIYSASAKGEEEILRWILTFGEEAEILQPVSLKEKMQEMVEKMHQIYSCTYAKVAEPKPRYKIRKKPAP